MLGLGLWLGVTRASGGSNDRLGGWIQGLIIIHFLVNGAAGYRTSQEHSGGIRGGQSIVGSGKGHPEEGILGQLAEGHPVDGHLEEGSPLVLAREMKEEEEEVEAK